MIELALELTAVVIVGTLTLATSPLFWVVAAQVAGVALIALGAVKLAKANAS